MARKLGSKYSSTLRNTAFIQIKSAILEFPSAEGFTVFIYFERSAAPRYFTKKKIYSGAVKYLHEMGFLDRSNFLAHFMVEKATGSHQRYSLHSSFSATRYDQVEVAGNTVYKPPTTAVATTSS
jgi:hypothetical protein